MQGEAGGGREGGREETKVPIIFPISSSGRERWGSSPLPVLSIFFYSAAKLGRRGKRGGGREKGEADRIERKLAPLPLSPFLSSSLLLNSPRPFLCVYWKRTSLPSFLPSILPLAALLACLSLPFPSPLRHLRVQIEFSKSDASRLLRGWEGLYILSHSSAGFIAASSPFLFFALLLLPPFLLFRAPARSRAVEARPPPPTNDDRPQVLLLRTVPHLFSLLSPPPFVCIDVLTYCSR